MINKQSLWFVTLFSLILLLSVYYITMPNELLLAAKTEGQKDIKKLEKDNTKITIEESEILTALKVEEEEKTKNKIDELQQSITKKELTSDEKNQAYEEIKNINTIKGKEEQLVLKIKEKFQKDAFVKIDNNQIRVVVAGIEHSKDLANNIMRSIQEEFDTKMYISVKFQK